MVLLAIYEPGAEEGGGRSAVSGEETAAAERLPPPHRGLDALRSDWFTYRKISANHMQTRNTEQNFFFSENLPDLKLRCFALFIIIHKKNVLLIFSFHCDVVTNLYARSYYPYFQLH